jgi:agmatine/peptidylarginine deiminase/tetratricopeptide (TPR) repeat protein
MLLLFAAATTISIISAHSVRNQWYRTEEILKSTAEDRGQALDSLERVFTTMMRQRARDDYPVSPETFQVLAELTATYTRFVQRHANDPSRRMDLVRAHRLLGRVYSLQTQVDRAEAEFREVRKILLDVADEDPRPEYRYLLAENSQQLSHLLAELDRTHEASQLGLDAMRELAKLADEFPNVPPYDSALAVAYNNLGLLSVKLGRDEEGVQYLRQNLSIWEHLIRRFPDDLDYVERLIDSQQVLLGLLWSMGRLDEAKQVGDQSLSAIRKYKQTFQDALHLEIPRSMALKNMAGIEDAMAIGHDRLRAGAIHGDTTSSQRFLFSEWNWTPLAARDGRAIQPDILVNGVLPADFEHHDALLLGFTWSLGEVWKKVCLEIVAATWQRVEIIILVPDTPAQEMLIDSLREINVPLDQIHFYQIPVNTVWVRDYGPLVIKTGERGCKWVDLQYGAIERSRDDNIPSALGRLMRVPRVRACIAFDGGNLLTNGHGLCLATTQLLERNREFGYRDEYVTGTIKRLFGAEEIVYLEQLEGEKTGHVDLFAAFTAPDTVVVGDYSGVDPVNAAILDRNAERLSKVVTASGPLRVVRLPMPPRGGDYFDGTYTNVLFANGVLLVPSWPNLPRETEDQVMATYRRLLPGWEVVGINVGNLMSHGGALRCVSLPLYRTPAITRR